MVVLLHKHSQISMADQVLPPVRQEFAILEAATHEKLGIRNDRTV